MGIDVYLRWDGITKKEERGQITGFDSTKGHVGYLREAYHGGPYATQYFVKEAFKRTYPPVYEDVDVKIPAAKLKKRLPKAIKMAIRRLREVYGIVADEKHPDVQSYVNFVKLAEKKEKQKKEPCTVIASY